ncbi:MAG: M48 family metalloprotease [Deltaproteobacteria bacterium]|nr:M48 family metalloprotease [Deltaproteobacteria bacterium]
MFNNIIYFVIVLLVFNMSPHNRDASGPLLYNIFMTALFWLLYAFMCRAGFRRLIRLYERGSVSGYSAIYSRLVFKLSVSAIIIFCIDVLSFNLKGLIGAIPFLGGINIFQGLSAVVLFMLYLSTMWYFAQPAYCKIFGINLDKKGFISGNIRFNIHVIFPWLLLSIVSDLITYSPFTGLKGFLERPLGQIGFFVLFLIIIMIYIPVVIRYFWGCKPLTGSPKAEGIRRFLSGLNFKYRDIVSWPLLEGKLMTAGIMGILPGYRYIMITDSLMDILTPPELNAVVAHEAGHAIHKHQVKLTLLFLGFFILVTGLIDSEYFLIFMGYLISKISPQGMTENLSVLFFTAPLIISLIIYFRFIMGFFMRHFERQADTYAALIINDPSPIISSLEKIALLSGKTRDVPSWHHFSIRQRVEFLLKINKFPGLVKRHKRLVHSAYITFIAGLLLISILLYVTPVKKYITGSLITFMIKNEAKGKPDDIGLMMNLAMAYHGLERLDEARELYEKIIRVDRSQADALNNLAWLLLTSESPEPDDIWRGFELAQEAVNLERSPVFLDTLAEAWFLMGKREEAVRIIEEAIMLDKGNPHYRRQYERFTARVFKGL